jgi:tetratricopeptide (TPR) repeat protein
MIFQSTRHSAVAATLAGLAVLLSLSAAWAQAPAPALSDEDLAKAFQQMTPEEIEKMVQAAALRRLEVERQQVLAEMQGNILYMMDDIARAKAILNDNPPNTQADNITRIARAYAAVDPRFAKAWDLYQKQTYPAAAEAFQAMRNPEEATYLSAAVHYFAADTLARSEKHWPAVNAYTDLLVNLPDRISFASAGALHAARTYQKMGRGFYAMDMLRYAVTNYHLTMSQEELRKLMGELKDLQDIYAEPMATLADRMDEIHRRLERNKVGTLTQDKQGQVVALLEDLIKTIEEKQQNKNSSNQNQQQQRRQGEKDQKDRGQAGGQASVRGNPQGENPSGEGAKISALVPGPVSRPNRMSEAHDGDDSGRWANLPPRQREQIRNLIKQRLSERRGDLVRDYHRKLAETPKP